MKLVDVALRKSTSQSSTFSNDQTYGSTRANDGHINTFTATNKQSFPYWWVDLGDSYEIERIEIVNRRDCCGESIYIIFCVQRQKSDGFFFNSSNHRSQTSFFYMTIYTYTG